jgi:hypothetical protein
MPLYILRRIKSINPIMNTPIRIVSTLVLVLCIVSCKKDKDSNSNKTRLSKMLQWSTGSPSKGIVTYQFIYDDQKRVVEIATLSGDSVNKEIRSAKIRSLKFLYNGNEQSPYKTIGAFPYSSNPTAEIYHKYNSNGSLVQDSTPAPSSSSSINLRNYSYNSVRIIVNSEVRDNWGSYVQSRDSFRVANNNLTEAYVGSLTSAYKVTYDDKTNPLSKLNIAPVFQVTSNIGFPSYLAPGSCKNNIMEYTSGYINSPGQYTPNNIYYFTYFYNGNNLPEECRYSGGGGNYTVRYEYID